MKKKWGGHIWVVGRRGVEGCSTQQGKRKKQISWEQQRGGRMQLQNEEREQSNLRPWYVQFLALDPWARMCCRRYPWILLNKLRLIWVSFFGLQPSTPWEPSSPPSPFHEMPITLLPIRLPGLGRSGHNKVSWTVHQIFHFYEHFIWLYFCILVLTQDLFFLIFI